MPRHSLSPFLSSRFNFSVDTEYARRVGCIEDTLAEKVPMELKELQRTWNEFGRRDPFWAILTHEDKKNGRWDLDEFFQTGRDEIDTVLATAASRHSFHRRERALDFGCGVGRLTQALCKHFGECHGVDLAPSMIELAEQHNQFGERCRYHVNTRSDLALFADDTFDFIYTNLVLQHMLPVYAKKYIAEFLRVLAPGGLVVFQIPSEVAITALPTSAFQARLTMLRPPVMRRVGRAETLCVRVQNCSDVTWPASQRYSIRLANHWLHADGSIFLLDDARTPLPHDLPSGEAIQLPLRVNCPRIPGNYLLEMDMVQEMVGWFSQYGATQTARLPVTVRRSLYGKVIHRFLRGLRVHKVSKGQAPWEPSMAMNGIPRPEVVQLVQDQGGRVLDVVEEDRTGQRWISFNYWITK